MNFKVEDEESRPNTGVERKGAVGEAQGWVARKQLRNAPI